MKIFLETYDPRYKDRIAFLDKIKATLKKVHGIEFVEKYSDADIVMTQQVGYSPSLDFSLNQKKDVIILGVSDTATIFDNNLRSAIKSDRVKGFFKVTNFYDLSCHNEPTSGDIRYHANFIDKYENISKKTDHTILFSDRELQKIRCALPAFLNFRMDQVRQANSLSPHQRAVDINFAGTTDYTKNKNYVNLKSSDPKLELPRLISAHRKRCLKKVIEIKDKNNLDVILSDHKPMNQPQYWNSLYNSKICLSPWGFGAYNWRDYESIYLGALLVKPDTSFLETYCNLFQDEKNYIKCSHDFEDLDGIVEDCIKNYEKYDIIRKNALDTLNHHSDIGRISHRFAKQIEKCLN